MNLLLEGDDLEALLLRAHREGGSAARIVRAQKVRRGGILGFFAKEGFEVAVEIPKDGEPDAGAPDPALAVPAVAATAMPQLTGSTAPAAIEAGSLPAGSLLGLADRTSAAERAATLAITQQIAYESAIQAAVDTLNDAALDVQHVLPAGSSPAERLAAKVAPNRALPPVEPYQAVEATVVETTVEATVVETTVEATVVETTVEATVVETTVEATVVETTVEATVVEATVLEPTIVEPRIVESDFALAEVVEILAGGFTAIEFPHLEFPEDQPETQAMPLLGAQPELKPVIVNNLTANSMARATTVVPRAKSRRGGHRAVPNPRFDSGETPYGSSIEGPSSGDYLDPDDLGRLHEDGHSADARAARKSGQHAAERLGAESRFEDAPLDVQSSAETSWKLLRRWRPGLRKQAIEDAAQFSREVDPRRPADPGWPDAEHWKHLAGPVEATELPRSPEAAETVEIATVTMAVQAREVAVDHDAEDYGTWTTVVLPDVAVTPFADAATLGDVPAGTDLIEGFNQLTADREALRVLGVPAAWTEHLYAGDRFGSIVAMLDHLAEPRIREDAAVIAVVGPADVVELEAHRTALDLPASGRPRAVTLVPGAVGVDRRAAIARSKRIRPVVISVPIEGYDDAAGTRKILTSIKAEAVIVVVDASRPLAEITAWVQALEQVDAIALDGALDVQSPAAVLGLDVPVIRVDGIAVDRIGWAALLCAQLAALDASR